MDQNKEFNPTEFIKNQITDSSIKLISKLKDFMEKTGLSNFYIAGGAFQKTVNDYDIFPIYDETSESFEYYNTFVSKASEIYKTYQTRNAISFDYNGTSIQYCRYYHRTLKELIESFDFAHCQVGAKIVNGSIEDVYFTEDYIKYRLLNNSYYIHSKYPLSSLMRLFKYKKREIVGNNYKVEVIKIISDIFERGYIDYDDFKDQLDAVDLCFKINKEDREVFTKLFNLLAKNKNEKNLQLLSD